MSEEGDLVREGTDQLQWKSMGIRTLWLLGVLFAVYVLISGYPTDSLIVAGRLEDPECCLSVIMFDNSPEFVLTLD
jgi:hypothetical protein